MYTMKQVCDELDLSYETLRYYCNEGLVPNVRRDTNDHRVFDERNLQWLRSLQCLRRCGLSIKEVKVYLQHCLDGPATIPARQQILTAKKTALLQQIAAIQESVAFIDDKQAFYDGVLAGRVKYRSNLIDVE